MGEVYKARDDRLDRFVAIKVLPSEVASDPDRLRRFEREARAASALNHPNIVTVYDIGSNDSVSYIAMELVEGRTLRDLLLLGPLPIKKLLDLGIQIAEGLAGAHEAGIIHRDLKPANVMITKEGFAKILDFGLAKTGRPRPDLAAIESEGSTETFSVTGAGQVAGTVSYMSPEQASGRTMDFRSDQFSFGIILYEMAAGRRPFQRETAIDVLAAILRDEPAPLAELQPAPPAPLRWIVERCLSKHPEDRFSSTRDLARDLATVREHLSEIRSETPSLSFRARSPWRRTFAAGLILATILALAFLVVRLTGRPANSTSMRFAILPPENASFNFGSSAPAPPAFSPDGRRIVFGARDSGGKNLLWIRSMDADASLPLPDTENATYPFWSPDGRYVGFFAEGKLRRVALSGGAAQTLCDASEGYGGSWSSRNVILFAPDRVGPLYTVSANGGTRAPATRVDSSIPGLSHRWPSFLPDGVHFLYLVRVSGKAIRDQGIHLGSLDSSESKLLAPDVSNAAYVGSGYLLFSREGALVAAAFDPSEAKIHGELRVVAERVTFHPYRSYGVFAGSGSVLAYQTAPTSSSSQLVWFDRTGRRLSIVGQASDYAGIRASPDGRFCAAEVRDPRTGSIDVWIFDLIRGISTRCTHGPSINDSPVWSPDGNSLAFSSNRSGRWALYRRPASGGGEDEVLLQSEDDKFPTDWSHDGRLLAFSGSSPGSNEKWGLWNYDLPAGEARPFLRTPFNEREARISPNGAWVSYTSDETGKYEIYVRELAGGARKWQISDGGGAQSLWRRDGRELFFLSSDNHVTAVDVTTTPTFEVGTSKSLFQAAVKESSTDTPLYCPSPDGQRFLVNVSTATSGTPALTVAVGWTSEVKR